MKPLSLASLIIGINLFFVNANTLEDDEHRPRLFEHRPRLNDGEAAAEVPVVEKYTCTSVIAIDKIRYSSANEEVQTIDNTDASNKQGGQSLRKRGRHLNKENKPNEPDESFVCELEDGSVVSIDATDEQMREMRSALRDGDLVSQVSTMEVDIMPQTSQDQIVQGGDFLTARDNKKKIAKLPPGSIKTQTKARRLAEHSQRRLGTLFRTNRMLVILVNDIEERKPSFGARETSDKIFGTNGDPETPSVQLSGCSNNQTSLTPDSGDPAVNSLMDAPGVVEVNIAISISPFDGPAIENAAIEAAMEKLGIRLPGMFDFVAIVIEDCLDSSECGFAAYAYLNSWKSLYVKDFYTYPAIMTHELGHNFNLGHSGLTRTYDDWSCSMGNPLWGDHLDKMCFNPAKNWQIAHHGAWYVEHKSLLDPRTIPVSSHRLVGVSEYGLIESSYPTALAVMKLESRANTDYFLGFNRANRQNADNRLASNEVTLIKAGNNGEGYSESTFLTGLKQGENYTIPDFGGSGEELIISVDEIDISGSPGYADVSIVYGSPSSTPAPTPFCKGKWMKVTVDTDNYPGETSWEVLDKCDNDAVVMSVGGGQYTKASERYEKNKCVPDSRYEFIIHDRYGDGVCCSGGSGSYNVEYGSEVVVHGGEFGGSDTTTFGSCVNSPNPSTAQPTIKPSASPTSEPTIAPTNFPTKAPTSFPTDLPTTMPSSQPSSQPTSDAEVDSGGGTSKKYTTPNISEATDKANGVIFTITAKSRDIIITALGIVGMDDGGAKGKVKGKEAKKSDIRVFSHAGSYESFLGEQLGKKRSRRSRSKTSRSKTSRSKTSRSETSRSKRTRSSQSNVADWDEYFEDKVVMYPQEIVDVNLDEEITIPAGDTVSVYVVSKKGFSYKESACNEFDVYAESDDFVLKVGTTTKKEFKHMEKLADFAGRIVYQTGVSA